MRDKTIRLLLVSQSICGLFIAITSRNCISTVTDKKSQSHHRLMSNTVFWLPEVYFLREPGEPVVLNLGKQVQHWFEPIPR